MLNNIKQSLTLAGVSAGLMYFFDPDLGRRRRALVRDQVVHAMNKIRDAADVTVRDLENRASGMYHECQSAFQGGEAPDEVVADRVRSKLGRYVSHPAAIDVDAHDGCVTLSGPILAAELQALVSAVESVNGVQEVENCLEVHESAENISALQGGARPAGEPSEWMQANWSPAARFVAGTTGGLLMLNCLTKRTAPAMICGTAGLALLGAALRNPQFSRSPQTAGGQGIGEGRSRQAPRNESESWREVPAGPNTPQGDVWRTASPTSPTQAQQSTADDLIDEASMESFPASDAPSFTRH